MISVNLSGDFPRVVICIERNYTRAKQFSIDNRNFEFEFQLIYFI